MSALGDARSGARPDADRRPAHRTTVVVAVASALVALGLGGHGLLVPAGDNSSVLRVVGAVVALGAVAVLVRLDGPARGTRTLGLVAVCGALVALATLPASPVTIDGSGVLDALPTEAPPTEPDAGRDTVLLEQVGPDGTPADGVLEVPPGATVVIEGGDVVLRLPGGGSTPLGRAGGDAAAGGAAPAPGSRPGVVVVDGGVTRTDGGPIGGDTPLGGVALDGGVGGTRVVVGEGVLLDVPEPEAAPVPDDVLDGPFDDGTDVALAVLLVAFALLAFAPPVVRATAWARTPLAEPTPPPTPVAEPTAGDVEEGLADVLRSMLADPDPRTAVIGAYARLLAALAAVGFPRRAEEAPHEHLWRSLGPLGVRRAPLHRLAELFVLARFTPRPVTEAHRQAAIGALADAVADLRIPDRDVAAAARRVTAPVQDAAAERSS